MLGDIRLNAAKRAAPFSVPQVREVERLDAGLAPSALDKVYTVFPHHTARKLEPHSSQAVDFPLLVTPNRSDDLTIGAVSVHRVPAHFGVASALHLDVDIGIDVEAHEALAALLNVTALAFPIIWDKTDLLGTSPRVYGRTDSDDASNDHPSLLPTEAAFASGDCKHGLSRGACDTCHRERAAKQKKLPTGERGVSIADLLELLWLYLQPPLDPKTFTAAFPFPGGMELEPYQIQGIQFLVERRGALLADEMGLGKTAQAIVAARLLFRKAVVTRVLVVAPKSILRNWLREWELWAQREVRIQVVEGPKVQRQQQWDAPAHVWIVSYETLRGDLAAVQQLAEFDLVILDEAAKVKNPGAKTTGALQGLPRKRCWALTGTPLETKIDDLISILRLIAVDALTKAQVKAIVAALPRWEHWLTPEQKEKLMQPVMLRRQIGVLDLPEPVEVERWLELTPEQGRAYRSAYDASRSEAQRVLGEVDENRARVHLLALIQKLKQLCNFDPETGSSAKADFLVEHLREIAPEDKILVFSQYPNVSLPDLKDRLQNDFPILDIYHGGLSTRRREDLQKLFEHDSRYRVLLMGLKAGGVGLNLQVANHVVLFDHWWNPATHKQALGRALRKNQEKDVFFTSLFTLNTVEQWIYQKLQEKKALFQAYVDDPSKVHEKVEESLTLEDLIEALDLPLPKQRARQEKMDSRLRGNDGGAGVPRERIWSGAWDGGRLRELSPYEFEELVARLYQEMGYRADRTRDSRDGGVDVVAERQMIGAREKRLIQCKHTESGSVVGVAVVRQLAGVLGNTPDATNAVVVTNGAFSKDAQREVHNSRVELVDGQHLLFLLDRYPLS